MRWGRYAYGFQYRCEIMASTVGEWRDIPECQASLIEVLGAEGAAKLEGTVATRLPDFRRSTERLSTYLFRAIV
jgi:hypothetical protein